MQRRDESTGCIREKAPVNEKSACDGLRALRMKSAEKTLKKEPEEFTGVFA